MPRYDYACEKCGEVVEISKPMEKPDPKWHNDLLEFVTGQGFEASTCTGKLDQVLQRIGVKFKGTGWYVTDYGKGK